MQQKLNKCAYNVASEGGKRNNNFPLIIILLSIPTQEWVCRGSSAWSLSLLPAQGLPRSERT